MGHFGLYKRSPREQVREFRRKETITANPARYKLTKRVQHESCCWTDRCRCTCRAAHSASGDGAVRRHRPVRQGPRARRDLCVNPAVAQCCSQFDALLANIDAVLAQGVTAPVPVMSCTLLPPVELSQECYQDLLSAGANCYYETNVMIQFFNEPGLLGTAVDASKTGEVS